MKFYFIFILLFIYNLISAQSTVINWASFPTNSASWSSGANVNVTTITAGGGSKSIMGSSASSAGLTPSAGNVASGCSNQTGLRLEMSGAGNGSGTGVWNNSVTLTIDFPSYVCAPVTFSIFDLTENLWNDGTNNWVYYQDKVTISALSSTNAAITPTATVTGGAVSSISGSNRVLTANKMAASCMNQNVSIGTSGTLIKQITITYSNQDVPNNCSPCISPYRYGISQYQYIFISNITAQCVTTLPVTLSNFEINCKENNTQFNWTTQSEENNDYFVIQGSEDAVYFDDLSIVKGAGNSQKELVYTKNIERDKNKYYRLKQVDFDGKTSYSETIYSNCQNEEISVTPNPFKENLNLSITLSKSTTLFFEIINQQGKTVTTFEKELEKGVTEISNFLPIGLEYGIYFIRISDELNQINQSIKIVKI